LVRVKLDDGFLDGKQNLDRLHAGQLGDGVLNVLSAFGTVHAFDGDFETL